MAAKKKTASLHAHHSKSFENITYREKEIREREFTDCRFLKCDLYGANFADSMFTNCVFDGCDLSLMKLQHCSFVNVHIMNSKAMGILWHETVNPFSVKFSDSCLDYSNFYGKILKKLQVVNCQARDVDFTKCNLTEANFEGTDLAKATFNNTDISRASFIHARNYFINMYVNTVKQAKFSMPEAISLLNNFDIIVME